MGLSHKENHIKDIDVNGHMVILYLVCSMLRATAPYRLGDAHPYKSVDAAKRPCLAQMMIINYHIYTIKTYIKNGAAAQRKTHKIR